MRLARRSLSSATSGLLRGEVAGLGAIERLLSAQGHAVCDSHTKRSGLHPLVVPLAVLAHPNDEVIGLLRWPSSEGGYSLVRTRPQNTGETGDVRALSLRPCGTIAQYARRAAAEADQEEAGPRSTEIISAAEEVARAVGGPSYTTGDAKASRLKLAQFLLVRVGPFVDVWETIARGQLERGDETAALVAGERCSATNPGWGCSPWLQSELMAALGRPEERRDLALSALECPFWTLGVPVRKVLAAAQLSHIDNVRLLVRSMEDKVREQQGAPPRSPRELALIRALDALDDVVRTEGAWGSVRETVAAALDEAGLKDAARIASE